VAHLQPPHTPPGKGGRTCPHGCETHGVCNAWTGQCECPSDYHGAACDMPVMPDCMLQGAPFDVARWLGDWIHEQQGVVTAVVVLGDAGGGDGGDMGEGEGGGGEVAGGVLAPPPRTITNVLAHSGPIPCECLRQAQNLPNLLTLAVENTAIYNTAPLGPDTKHRKLGGILCIGDLPDGVSWDELVEKGGAGGSLGGGGGGDWGAGGGGGAGGDVGGGGGGDVGGDGGVVGGNPNPAAEAAPLSLSAYASFRLMPPDLMAPVNRDINGKGDYDRDRQSIVTEPKGIRLTDARELLLLLRPRGGDGGGELFNPVDTGHFGGIAAMSACGREGGGGGGDGGGIRGGGGGNGGDWGGGGGDGGGRGGGRGEGVAGGGGGCGHGGWCARVVDPTGAAADVHACVCYSGASHSGVLGGPCQWDVPSTGSNMCARGPGLTLVHFSAQPEPFLTKIHPRYPLIPPDTSQTPPTCTAYHTESADAEPRSGRV